MPVNEAKSFFITNLLCNVTLIRPLDSIIIVFILISTGLAFYLLKGNTGSKAEIHLGSKRIARFELQGDDRIKLIDTRIGQIKVRVGNGSIQVLSSPCDQKICILQGAIHNTHEHIVCLPAQMYISIVNSENADNLFDDIDAISH